MKQIFDLNLEIKALGAREFEGFGSTFGNVDLGGDIILPGAFSATLAEHKSAGTMPLMFWMHDARQVPGRWLDMTEDSKGLHVTGELVDTPLGNEMRTLLQKQAVRGLSIGYETIDATFDRNGNRQIGAIKLWEVSIVSLAMNPLAQIEAVKARLSADGEYVPDEAELARIFIEFGCNPAAAVAMVRKIHRAALN